MFFKKKKRSAWMEGLLTAEKIIQRDGSREQVYFTIGCVKGYSASFGFYYTITTNLATISGALDYLDYKGVE